MIRGVLLVPIVAQQVLPRGLGEAHTALPPILRSLRAPLNRMASVGRYNGNNHRHSGALGSPQSWNLMPTQGTLVVMT